MSTENPFLAEARWQSLPPELADLFAPTLAGLGDEIIAAIAAEVPEYARPLEGDFGRAIRRGVAEALRQFVAMVTTPEGRGQGREVYRALGRGEWREGRSLDALQAAYRVGARVAWRRTAETGLRAGLEPETLCALADAIFGYIDELSSESVEGYAQAQAAAAGERDRSRRRLAALLVSDAPREDAEVERAAAEAGWRLPATAAALACRADDLRRLARRLPADCLGVVVEERGCLVVPDPHGPGRADQLTAAGRGIDCALGPAVDWRGLAHSWRRARLGLHAVESGAVRAGALVDTGEELLPLALFQSRDLMVELAERRLACLADLTPRKRARLRETLLAYLRLNGSTPAMASELNLHPQTVRYRLAQLRELFGDGLDDPEARFELEAALRASEGEPAEPGPGRAAPSAL